MKKFLILSALTSFLVIGASGCGTLKNWCNQGSPLTPWTKKPDPPVMMTIPQDTICDPCGVPQGCDPCGQPSAQQILPSPNP